LSCITEIFYTKNFIVYLNASVNSFDEFDSIYDIKSFKLKAANLPKSLLIRWFNKNLITGSNKSVVTLISPAVSMINLNAAAIVTFSWGKASETENWIILWIKGLLFEKIIRSFIEWIANRETSTAER